MTLDFKAERHELKAMEHINKLTRASYFTLARTIGRRQIKSIMILYYGVWYHIGCEDYHDSRDIIHTSTIKNVSEQPSRATVTKYLTNIRRTW